MSNPLLLKVFSSPLSSNFKNKNWDESKKIKGLDSLLSIAQMPKGIPVGTLAIGKDGAINAALLATSIIANNNSIVSKRLEKWRASQTKSVKKRPK